MSIIYKCICFLFLAAIQFAQTPTDELKSEAEEFMSDGRYGEAIGILNRFISEFPQNSYGYNLRGICYENRNQYEFAVYDFRSALKLDSGNKEFRNNLNHTTEIWQQQLYNKILGYNREIALDPQKAINYLEIGKCYKNLGDWSAAEIWYDKYLEKEEASADEIIRYTEILAKNNHISKGEPILKKYTQKYPDDHRLWSRYGYFTMWLGKKQTALIAFKTALELRPYFKEALDGYDLVQGKGYVYTVNDTTARFNYGLPVKKSYSVYPIDKYFKKLKSHPEDDQTRINLIIELVNKNRFEEAVEQLNILEQHQKGYEKYITLKENVFTIREKYYDEQIIDLRSKLKGESSDKEIVTKLANMYAIIKQYDEASYLLKNHLQLNPEDDEARYLYALIKSWNGNFSESKNQVGILLDHSPNELKYHLLNGQLSSWMGFGLEDGKNSLNAVLKSEPQKYEALLALASIYLQQNNLNNAQNTLNDASTLNPDINEIAKLQYSIDHQTKVNEENELYAIVENAREKLAEKNCDESISLYLKYFTDEKAKLENKRELAEAYLCMNNFSEAIKIYDELIFNNPDDLKLVVHRAKLFYWAGNYEKAAYEFDRLLKENPDDAEIKLFLADALFEQKNYTMARNLYQQMLEISPDSHILKTRINWLGSEGSGTQYSSDFPTYMMLTPEAYYYSDNLNFKFSNYGMSYEVGVNQFLTLGIAGYGGILGSDSLDENITILKGSANIKLNKFISTNFTFGSTLFDSFSNSFLSEISLTAAEKNKYSFTVNFNTADAAQILYSPFLIPVRLRTYLLAVQGNYKTKSDWIFSGLYSYLAISDKNNGNKMQLRLGKVIEKSVGVGYEYYFFDLKDQSPLYWSPKNFESHSLWAEWYISETEKFNATIGGKVGYIPSSKFVLREFFGSTLYRIAQSFALMGRLTFGTTVQAEAGYSSASFSVSGFWYL